MIDEPKRFMSTIVYNDVWKFPKIGEITPFPEVKPDIDIELEYDNFTKYFTAEHLTYSVENKLKTIYHIFFPPKFKISESELEFYYRGKIGWFRLVRGCFAKFTGLKENLKKGKK